MPTIKQLSLNSRKPKKNVTRSPALIGCPQRRGTCIRVYVRLGKLITNNNLITVNCYITYG